MSDFIGPVIDPVISSSEKLAALTPAGIFAFMWLWQSIKEWRRESRDSVEKKKTNELRENLVIAEERQTESIRVMAQNISMLRDSHNATTSQLSKLTTILEERIPRHEHT